MERFEIRVSEAILSDLRERLYRTRWPDEADGAGWSLGTDRAFLQRLVEHWLERFDWRGVEARLNTVPQFTTTIEGQRVHFVHARAAKPKGALVLAHGWPSSFAEMLPLVAPLTAEGFDVVIPSLPGFIFSTPHTQPGPRRYADTFAKLMAALGYERFGACGTDIGARITSHLGMLFPEHVTGIHISSVDLEWPDPLPTDLNDEERDYVARFEAWKRNEGAYAAQQSTYPQTLGYGLTDSPAGLAAWIVEKFRAWSDCGGDITSRFSMDELLTTVTLYWATNSINSANRSYHAHRHDPAPPRLRPGQRIEVPAGIAMFPGEAQLIVPRSFAERCYRIARWTDMPRGGHFAALEEPELLAADIRAFFSDVQRLAAHAE
jgi:pimeloyl-ACP methyl ester carboxylesterase